MFLIVKLAQDECVRGLETVESYSERTCSYVLSNIFEDFLWNSSFLNEIAMNLKLKLATFLNMKPFTRTFQVRLGGILKAH